MTSAPTEKKLSEFPVSTTLPTTGDFFVGVRESGAQPVDVLFTTDQVIALFGADVLQTLPLAAAAPSGADDIIGVQNGDGVRFTTTQLNEFISASLVGFTAAATPPAAPDEIVGVQGGTPVAFTTAQFASFIDGTVLPALPVAPTAPVAPDEIVGIQGGSGVAFTTAQIQETAVTGVLAAAAANPAEVPPQAGDFFLAENTGAIEQFSFAQMASAFAAIAGAPDLAALPGASAAPTGTDTVSGVQSGAGVLYSLTQMHTMVAQSLNTFPASPAAPTVADSVAGIRSGGSGVLFTGTQLNTASAAAAIAALPAIAAATTVPTAGDKILGIHGSGAVLFNNTQMTSAYTAAIPAGLAALSAAAGAPVAPDTLVGVHGGVGTTFTVPQIQLLANTGVAAVATSVNPPSTGDLFVGSRGGALEQFSFAQMQTAFPGGGGGAGNFWTVPYPTNLAASLPAPFGAQRMDADRWFDVLNVKDFGAVGDGITDDYPAIQKVFNFNQIAVSSGTTSGNLLHFASALPSWVQKGLQLANITHHGAFFGGTYIFNISTDRLTITMNSSIVGGGNVVVAGDIIMIGQLGKIYFPPGRYSISQTIQLPLGGIIGTPASLVIQGCGQQSRLIGTGFNGFVLDDALDGTAGDSLHPTGGPWSISDLYIQNSYVPRKIYKVLTAGGGWAIGDSTIELTNASITAMGGIAEGAIIFIMSLFSSAGTPPGYVGYVKPGGVDAPGATTTVLHLGDATGANLPSNPPKVVITLAGATYNVGDTLSIIFNNAAIPSWAGGITKTYTLIGGDTVLTVDSKLRDLINADATLTSQGVAATSAGLTGASSSVTIVQPGSIANTTFITVAVGGTGTETMTRNPTNGQAVVSDSIFAVQGFFAAQNITTATTAITMAQSNPGLDSGSYHIWDFSKVTNHNNIIPQWLGCTASVVNKWVPASLWTGTTLTLNAHSAITGVNATEKDLLVLSPVSGALRHVSAAEAVIDRCTLSGILACALDETGAVAPTDATGGGWFQTVRNCTISTSVGNAGIGSIGVFGGQGTFVENCDLNGNWIGARLWGVNTQFYLGRAEVCAYGIVIGAFSINTVGNPGAIGCIIANTEFEGCWVAGICNDVGFPANIAVIATTLSNNHCNACYGFYIGSGQNLIMQNCSVSSSAAAMATTSYGTCGGFWNPSFRGSGTPAGIYIGDSSVNPQRMTFISNVSVSVIATFNNTNGLLSGPAWRMPTRPVTATFINCNNPPTVYTFSVLPAPMSFTGQISVDGLAGSATGTELKVTAGTFSSSIGVVGSAVVGPNIKAGTYIVGGSLTTLNVPVAVNQTPVNTNAGSITIYPMVDGDEYLISDSPIPATPTYAANGTWLTSGKLITMGTPLPGIILPGASVFDDTTNKPIGTVDAVVTTVTVSPGISSYDIGTGVVTLLLTASVSIPVGGSVFVTLTGGTGTVANLNGSQIAITGTTGNTLKFQAAAGQTLTIDTGVVNLTGPGTTVLKLVANALNASSTSTDVLAFSPVSNYGAAVTQGGGAYTVKVRWSAQRQNWIIT